MWCAKAEEIFPLLSKICHCARAFTCLALMKFLHFTGSVLLRFGN